MQINFHEVGTKLNEAEKAEMEDRLSVLQKYINEDPVVTDVYILDEAGKEHKNGVDQRVNISVLIGGEKIFIEEVDTNHIQAFARAYHRLKENLEQRHEKKADHGV